MSDETVGSTPLFPGNRMVLMEIWRPMRYVGSRGPRCFWRERRPKAAHRILTDAGWIDVPAGHVLEDPPPWSVMQPHTAKAYLSSPYIIDDAHPGVTFIVRKVPSETLTVKDWAQIRDLRARVLSP